MTKVKQLERFIKDNGLQFTEGRRNSDLVVLCGYGIYIEATGNEIWDSISEDVDTDFEELEKEFNRVFEYAHANNYGKWWEIEMNRKAYKL